MPSREDDFKPETELARALIIRRGVRSLEVAAKEAGLSAKTLSRFERGGLGEFPSGKNLPRLVRYLGEGWDAGRVIDAASRAPEEPYAATAE